MGNAGRRTEYFQRAYRIQVKSDENGEIVWDTGKILSGRALGVAYEGFPLQACTRYHVYLQVWDQTDEEAQTDGWFETGLMNPDISA